MKIDDLLISADISALEAMRRLDEAGTRIVFIAPGGKLEAVLTDSDIRKFILRGGDLNGPVSQVAHYAPRSLPVERRGEARALMLRHSIEAVPLLDRAGRIVDVVFLGEPGEVVPQKLLSTPVVIMAGGLGTRLYPFTKILPKPLIPVGEVPILERVMDGFHQFGCSDFTLIVNYRKNMIKSYFSESEHPYAIHYVEEAEPLGTGGGLSLLKGKMRETFFLANCDSLFQADYADIAAFHRQRGNAITMVCAMKEFVIPYGVVELGEEGELKSLAEKPRMNHLTNAGLYVVEPAVVEAVADGVRQGFTDIIQQCAAAGGRVGVYPIGEGSWMDMGQMEELDEMRRRFEKD